MNNPEDQNPLLPNLRDECLSGMNFFVRCIFTGFLLSVAAVIAWFIFSVTRPAKVVEQYASYYPSHGNIVIYPDDAVSNVVVMNNRFHSVTNNPNGGGFTIITNHQPARWFSFTFTDNNPHWTNVVFSSTREPVVTKTNGEWRIGFK